MERCRRRGWSSGILPLEKVRLRSSPQLPRRQGGADLSAAKVGAAGDELTQRERGSELVDLDCASQPLYRSWPPWIVVERP